MIKYSVKKKQIMLLSVLLTFLSISCSTSVKVESEEEKFFSERKELLSLKADSAYTFCKANGMNTEYCILTDMKIHSGKNRFFIWDFNKDSVIAEGMCAHGYGGNSTQEKPEFSNVPGSYCSSLGKYKIGIRSYSKWGINIHYKLHGLEKTNDKAFERFIVMHSFDYVDNEEIYPEHLPLGYSQGCPVISNDLMIYVDNLLKQQEKPVLFWMYY